MPARQITPPISPATHPGLILCADGGGSKVCVVIRSADGLEVRGVAGPCNVQSVGHGPAIQAILLATYRALSQLPATHLPTNLILPNLDNSPPLPSTANIHPSTSATPSTSSPSKTTQLLIPTPISLPQSRLAAQLISAPPSPFASRPGSPKLPPLPSLNVPLFQYVWLGLAGISAESDSMAFMPTAVHGLCIAEERVKITNDVNLLAAPALNLPGIKHVAAVVCGTGTVGRTIEIAKPAVVTVEDESTHSKEKVTALPLADVGVSRGWGWLLCDEGSAFYIGRSAIRSLLFHVDRQTRSSLYAAPPPSLLPFHLELMSYFGVTDPMELIGICSLIGPYGSGLSIGEATAKRSAYMAGAARTVLKWAFPEEYGPPSPPRSDSSTDMSMSNSIAMSVDRPEDEITASNKAALKIVQHAIKPLIELTMDLLGDGTVVRPETTALALGGGLWQSRGYRELLTKGLEKEGVAFGEMVVVDDAAGVGAKGLAQVEFGRV